MAKTKITPEEWRVISAYAIHRPDGVIARLFNTLEEVTLHLRIPARWKHIELAAETDPWTAQLVDLVKGYYGDETESGRPRPHDKEPD